MIKKYCFIMLLAVEPTAYGIWTNWVGNHFCNPTHIVCPKTVDDLRNYIQSAVLKSDKIRAVGSGHSYNDIVCADGLLLNMTHLNRILSVDQDKKQVRVEAGITMRDLNEQLALYDLALSNQAAIADITLAGALCTATHGTGHTGTLCSFVTEIELMTADGVIHYLSPSADLHHFNAALVSLGALGILYAVTLQCESLFFVQADYEIMDVDAVLMDYKTLYADNDFFQFAWDLETNRAHVYRWNRCDRKSVSAQNCFQALAWYISHENDKNFIASEIAVPFDCLLQAIKTTKRIIEMYVPCKMNVSTKVNIRFVEKDDYSYLSNASNGDIAYISVLTNAKNYLEFFEAFEHTMINEFQGRPHWGKVNFLDYAKVLSLYGTNFLRFLEVKKELDPQEVFSNEFVHRICTL